MICLDGEVEHGVIVLGPRDRCRVVGRGRHGEVIGGKAFAYLLPPSYASSRVGFRERPEVPRTPVRRISRNGSRRQLADDLGPTALEPIGVGEYHQSSGVVRLRGDDGFIDWCDQFRFIPMWFRGSDQRVRRRMRDQGNERRTQRRDVRGGCIVARYAIELCFQVG